MAPKHIELCLVLVLVTMLFHGAVAQSGCTTVLVGLAPCLNYITGNSSTPSSSCCSQLASVVQSQPRCLCSVLNSGGSSLGIAINQSQALALPGACNVQTPPASQCNTVNGPASSPVSPPADSSDEMPETPTSPPMPSIPSGSGSKTVPTADGSSSSGSIITMPLHFTVFILFLASCFSSAIKI
ncbi:AAI domain-containing protein [Citrus sinensis]|uniref:non-specific lipid transfer protein GPI-anchored 5-like n=1 Tax=Citrus sinensis TaxID=2711 RepID=UPI00219CC441|nr:non-specific lipid transfer protein GPI-anchored 5-like [Citrus sinensis]KAH9729786.1 AAI domain-containing protein [Citrus sinensis]